MDEAAPIAEKDVTWFPSLSAARSAVVVGSEIEVREVYITGEGGSSLRATRYYVKAKDLRDPRPIPPAETGHGLPFDPPDADEPTCPICGQALFTHGIVGRCTPPVE